MQDFYVYHLIDPRNNKVFYVGKGKGDRVLQHERDARRLRFANSEKEQIIHEIWGEGLSVKRRIVKRFSNEQKAYHFEFQEIKRIGIENLTNIAKGGESQDIKAAAKAKATIALIKSRMKEMSCFDFYNARKLVSELEQALSVAKMQLYKSQ